VALPLSIYSNSAVTIYLTGVVI